MVEYFVYAQTIIFLFLSIIWQRNEWKDVFIKVVLIFMTVFGGLISLYNLGFVLIPPALV